MWYAFWYAFAWNMNIGFEDNYEDVLTKAAVGQKLGHTALARAIGLDLQEVKAVFSGEFEAAKVRVLAEALGLSSDRVIAMATEAWRPDTIDVPGIHCINTPFPESGYPDATVNNFILSNPETREAILFDTGMQAEATLRVIESKNLKIQAFFLTHTHRDHVNGYEALKDYLAGVPSYAPELEPYADATPAKDGMRFELAGLQIEVRLTNGHAFGGVSYVVDGLDRKIAVVGDAIFSLSMGGARNAYAQALQTNRAQILSLPEDTVLCPGHGPLTTVGEELAHNPFF